MPSVLSVVKEIRTTEHTDDTERIKKNIFKLEIYFNTKNLSESILRGRLWEKKFI